MFLETTSGQPLKLEKHPQLPTLDSYYHFINLYTFKFNNKYTNIHVHNEIILSLVLMKHNQNTCRTILKHFVKILKLIN